MQSHTPWLGWSTVGIWQIPCTPRLSFTKPHCKKSSYPGLPSNVKIQLAHFVMSEDHTFSSPCSSSLALGGEEMGCEVYEVTITICYGELENSTRDHYGQLSLWESRYWCWVRIMSILKWKIMFSLTLPCTYQVTSKWIFFQIPIKGSSTGKTFNSETSKDSHSSNLQRWKEFSKIGETEIINQERKEREWKLQTQKDQHWES